MPIWALLAALGAAKAATIDQDKSNRERWLASQTQRYSPWTGLHAGPISEPDVFGGALAGGTSGLALDQSMKSANSQNALNDAMTKYYGGNLDPSSIDYTDPSVNQGYDPKTGTGGKYGAMISQAQIPNLWGSQFQKG